MKNGKIEAEKILQNEIKVNNSSNIRLVAYAAQVIIDSKEFLNINQDLLEKAASFIMSHQEDDGSFPYDKPSSHRVDIGSRSAQVIIQTAIVILPFLRDKKLNTIYHDNISKTIDYLTPLGRDKLVNDYENILIAYVLSLNGDEKESKLLLKNLKNTHNTARIPKLKSLLVESVSCIIFTKLRLNQDPFTEIQWLIGYRNTDGGFYSPYSTVMALQALYEYTKYTNFMQPNLKFSINKNKTEHIVDYLDRKHVQINAKQCNVEAFGKGLSYASVIYPQKFERKSFKIRNNVTRSGNGKYKIHVEVDIHGLYSISFRTVNFMIIEMEIPNGYKFDKISNDTKVNI